MYTAVKCPAASDISNAIVISGGVESLIGEHVLYSCKSGFVVRGPATLSTEFNLTCSLATNQVEGHWSGNDSVCICKCSLSLIHQLFSV